MLRFDAQKILPKFLSSDVMTIQDLAQKAGVSHQTADRAINGKRINGRVVRRIAHALGITDATEYLATPRSAMKGSESNEY